jgi:hypothetical protein
MPITICVQWLWACSGPLLLHHYQTETIHRDPLLEGQIAVTCRPCKFMHVTVMLVSCDSHTVTLNEWPTLRGTFSTTIFSPIIALSTIYGAWI